MRKLGRKIQKLLFREQWSVLVCDQSGKILKHICPPSDRSWADPFPVESDGHYYIFLEQQFNRQNGTLGYIELFDDLSYSDFVPILEKEYHLSYPYVFSAAVNGKNVWYMIPETNEHNAIELYRAKAFPGEWTHDLTLIRDIQAVDSSILFHEDRWYLFTSCETKTTELNNSLFAFSSRKFPSSEWKAFSANPVKVDASNGRMGGRVFVNEKGQILRPAQSCVREYGERLVMNRISELADDTFAEEKLFVVSPEKKLHAVCTHTWNACGNYIVRDIKTRRFRLCK